MFPWVNLWTVILLNLSFADGTYPDSFILQITVYSGWQNIKALTVFWSLWLNALQTCYNSHLTQYLIICTSVFTFVGCLAKMSLWVMNHLQTFCALGKRITNYTHTHTHTQKKKVCKVKWEMSISLRIYQICIYYLYSTSQTYNFIRNFKRFAKRVTSLPVTPFPTFSSSGINVWLIGL